MSFLLREESYMFGVLNKLMLHSEAFLLVFFSIFADYKDPKGVEGRHRVVNGLNECATLVEDGVLLLYLFVA